MKKRLMTPRDYETLSAYLDGQLSPKEVARLQVRLKDDRQMQMALQELRMTRKALRSLPALRAPRNFTLKPQMVGGRVAPRRPLYPAFGFASLVASLLLVLVFVADQMSFVGTAQTTALESAVQATQLEEVVQTMVVEGLAAEGVSAPDSVAVEKALVEAAEPVGEEVLRTADATPEELAGVLQSTYPEPTLPAFKEAAPETTLPSSADLTEAWDPALTITGAITVTSTPTITNSIAGWGIGGGPVESTATPEASETPTPTLTPEPSSTPEPFPVPTITPILESEMLQLNQAPSEPAAAQTGEQPAASEETIAPSTRQADRIYFLIAEIVLGLLAAASAILFIYLYRKSG